LLEDAKTINNTHNEHKNTKNSGEREKIRIKFVLNKNKMNPAKTEQCYACTHIIVLF